MSAGKLVRRLSVAAVSAALILGTAAVGQAAPMPIPERYSLSERQAVQAKVFAGSDDTSALPELTAREQAVLQYNLDNLTSRPVVERFGRLDPVSGKQLTAQPVPAALADDMTINVLATAAGGCWYRYHYRSVYDMFIHTGNVWMQLNWCSDGSRVTSSYVSNAGGQGLKGFNYAGSTKYYLNVSWEVRAAVVFRFTLGFVAGNPCSQVRGGASGMASVRSTCDLN